MLSMTFQVRIPSSFPIFKTHLITSIALLVFKHHSLMYSSKSRPAISTHNEPFCSYQEGTWLAQLMT